MDHLTDDMPFGFLAFDAGLALYFMVELLLRIAQQRAGFILSLDLRWNIFDLVLVLLSILQLIGNFVTFGEGGPDGQNSLRILRMLRMVRVIRVIRLLRIFQTLRLFMNEIL